MATEFVLDDSGKPSFDDNGLPLVKRNGETVPLDVDKLFQGIADSNRDAAAKRKALEAAQEELAAMKTRLQALEAAKESNGGKEPQESEELRRIKALEAALKKEQEEKAAIKAEQEKREIDRMIEEEFGNSAFAAEHSHIPLDFWLARYRSHCSLEDCNGQKMLIFKDGNGNVIMSDKNPGLPAKKDEALAFLCASRAKPGDVKLNPAPFGGSGAQQPQRAFANSNPWAKGQENVTMQHKIMAEDPALAHRLAANAGVRLPAL